MQPSETDRIEMWTCRKYGVKMMAVHSAVFCARRFAAATGKNGFEAAFFEHCRTCARGAAEYELSSGRDAAAPRSQGERPGCPRRGYRIGQGKGVHGRRTV